ncbi:MAG: Nif3-like dinuclear metal center hexameric protein, partial [Acutalibacteraceae bacterium]
MKVREIFDFLNELYPLHSAMEFDNPGLLVGDPEGEVSNILIALDCTMNTVKNAKNNACELIITHHPVIFSPLKKLLAGTVVFELIKSGISVISMHTNLDVAENGVNDFLCRTIGLTDTTLIAAADGFVLKGGRISPVTAQNFAKTLKAKLGGCVKYVDGGKPIEKVLV